MSNKQIYVIEKYGRNSGDDSCYNSTEYFIKFSRRYLGGEINSDSSYHLDAIFLSDLGQAQKFQLLTEAIEVSKVMPRNVGIGLKGNCMINVACYEILEDNSLLRMGTVYYQEDEG